MQPRVGLCNAEPVGHWTARRAKAPERISGFARNDVQYSVMQQNAGWMEDVGLSRHRAMSHATCFRCDGHPVVNGLDAPGPTHW